MVASSQPRQSRNSHPIRALPLPSCRLVSHSTASNLLFSDVVIEATTQSWSGAPDAAGTFRRLDSVPLFNDHRPLTTPRSCFKSFSCNTYGPPRKCCKQKTYALAKPFRCNTYKKHRGVGLLWLTRNSSNLTCSSPLFSAALSQCFLPTVESAATYAVSSDKRSSPASHSRTNRTEKILPNRLDGRVAAITGGSQGIGLAIAQRFPQEGADVAFCYRSNKPGAEEVAAGIRRLGRKAAGFQCDVGRVADGRKFIADTVAQFGKIDILVNNAGLERHADFLDDTEEDYDAVLNVNLKGVFFISQAFVKHRMQAQAIGKTTGGNIINISSVHAELPLAHCTSYFTS